MRYPSLSIDARSAFVDNIPSVEFPVIGSRELGAKESYQADIKLSVPLFTGGKIGSRIKVNFENLKAQSYALKAERMNSAYNCRRAYLGVLLAEAVLAAGEASLDRIDIIRRNVHNLYEGGLADSIDILEAELAYQQEHLAVSEKMSGVNKTRTSLALILGLPADSELKLTEDIAPPSDNEKQLSGPAQPKRAELKMLDHKIGVADHLSRLNVSQYFPDINGFAGYSYGKPNRDFFNSGWDDYWMAGLALNWELNLGRKTSHGINSARQRASSARMVRHDLERSLTILTETAVENMELAYQTMLTSKKEYEIARTKYRLAENKQNSGMLTVNRLLEIEAELGAAERLYRASIINYYLAQTEYLYAIGSEKIYGGL